MPNRALVGLVDACRPGDGVTRDQLRPAFDASLGVLHLNGHWFAVDNDSIFMGTDIANVSRIEGGWPLVRTWLSLVGLSGGSAITSDPWYQEGFRDYRRNLEVLTPPAREAAEVLDLCRDREWTRLIRHVARPWGRMTVALLWNPGSTERTVHLDFAAAGLDPASRYAVWSFWDNRYLGVVEGGWTTPPLAPGASQHVRFTPLAAVESRPVLVGSNLHIHCGAEEVRRVNSLQGAMEIELGGEGARDGDLFVYSRLRPELKAAEGCRAALAAAGEYVWRIRLEGRDLEKAQRVELAFLVPVTRQPWFWVLCALLLLALAAGARRYAAWRRLRFENEVLQQRQELSAERARLAQDLHDDLGASLSQIGLMTEQVERALASPEQARRELDRMYTVTRNIARQLDTMVWVVDPANDTLDKFINYLHGHAAEYLALAGIRMDFACASDPPHTDLPAKTRHHLLMAAKEALHNVVQHSGAARVSLRIRLRGSDLVMELEDDGNGLPAGGAPTSGNGLANMRKRMIELGGVFELRSPAGAGKGTLVRLTVPLGSVVQGAPA
ncbi:MAG: histidine kinase [Kiritimatiellia bacterium]